MYVYVLYWTYTEDLYFYVFQCERCGGRRHYNNNNIIWEYYKVYSDRAPNAACVSVCMHTERSNNNISDVIILLSSLYIYTHTWPWTRFTRLCQDDYLDGRTKGRAGEPTNRRSHYPCVLPICSVYYIIFRYLHCARPHRGPRPLKGGLWDNCRRKIRIWYTTMTTRLWNFDIFNYISYHA